MKSVKLWMLICLWMPLLFACSGSGSSGAGSASSDASLSSLVLSAGTVSPEFDQDVLSYAAEVSFDVSVVRVTATTADPSSRLSVNGSFAESGKPSLAIQLSGENNSIPVKVTAPDGVTVQTYIVNVVRIVPGTVSAPAFSLPDGTAFVSSLVVSMNCATAGASIRYTMDGSAPTEASALYASPITLTDTTTVRMIAVKSGMTPSSVVSASYTKSALSQVEPPVLTPGDGTTFSSTLTVSISCATAGAAVHYTTDGSTPTSFSALYSDEFSLSDTATVKAIAVKSGMLDSTAVSASYARKPVVIETAAAPVFSPAAGTSFTGTLEVSITSSTTGASIYYTTDGTEPSASSTLYSGGITLSATATVKAIAVKSGMNSSSAVSASYTKGAVVEPLSLNTGYYRTNPDGQVGKYKTTMNVTATGTYPKYSDGFSDWSSDLIIAQGAANDSCQAFRGSWEAPSFDGYSLYAAWDDSNLYLGWQIVNTVDITDPWQSFPLTNNGKPYNVDIRMTLAFDIDASKSCTGVLEDGKTGVWEDNGKWYNHFANGMDMLMNFSSKPGVGAPGVFYPNASNQFSYGAACCKLFSNLGIVYGVVDGLLPTAVYGVNKGQGWDPALLLLNTGFDDFLTLNYDTEYVVDEEGNTALMHHEHVKSRDTFYEIKIPLTVFNITRADLESKGIGVMLVTTYGCSATGSLPADPTVWDSVNLPYGPQEATSHEKEDIDTFTCKMARVGHL